jgi:hypothetical protein
MENAPIPNENKRLYVIGDIHGRLDLLDRLIAMIRRDAEEHAVSSFYHNVPLVLGGSYY